MMNHRKRKVSRFQTIAVAASALLALGGTSSVATPASGSAAAPSTAVAASAAPSSESNDSGFDAQACNAWVAAPEWGVGWTKWTNCRSVAINVFVQYNGGPYTSLQCIPGGDTAVWDPSAHAVWYQGQYGGPSCS